MPEQHAFPQMVWLEPDQNAFGVRVLDCRTFCQTMISVSADPHIAQSFLELRDSSGAHLRGKSPANAQRIAYPLRYPLPKGFATLCDVDDGPLFRAETMEDKWDIFLFDGWLYFARSWTGELVFRAGVKITRDDVDVCPVDLNSNVVEDPEFAVRQVDFLVKSHLLQMGVPHPLPADFPEEASQIAVYSFSQYGRRAAFATYADTLPLGVHRRFDPDATLPL